MTEFLTFEGLVAFTTLTALEVVLGIDNVIFIAILAGKLPAEQRDRARTWGLSVAVISRVMLVLMIGVIMRLDQPWFTVFGTAFSGKDMILIAGGLFLLGKATYEIHRKVTHAAEHTVAGGGVTTLQTVLLQVLMVDVVFSIDSVITAVGMTEGLPKPIPIMIAAIAVSVGIMLVFSKAITEFIERHPALKILALSFLLLIGTLLVAEGFHQHLSKGYVYFAMAFSLGIELLQMRAARQVSQAPVPHSAPEQP
jgi:predicted tellurium resistance membrane protein TerC